MKHRVSIVVDMDFEDDVACCLRKNIEGTYDEDEKQIVDVVQRMTEIGVNVVEQTFTADTKRPDFLIKISICKPPAISPQTPSTRPPDASAGYESPELPKEEIPF